ncbi:MAG: hypothetical protein CL528_13400 [Aequorivita sp.]|jgi:Na+-transporting NADH:ubiquinone oxidoreductase subunit NqrD|nr:hypothetical protein [Aequorivita sp.]|tara:strand:+ start:14357 stop:14614 length:258 start_codon:yes stop_codon:yes gene_type:complete
MNSKGGLLDNLPDIPGFLLTAVGVFFVVQIFGQIVIDRFADGTLSSPYQGFIIALVGFLVIGFIVGKIRTLGRDNVERGSFSPDI